MIKKFAIATVCGFVIFLTGCQKTKKEFSDTLHEEAVIEDVVYTPSEDELVCMPSSVPMGGVRIAEGIQVMRMTTVPEKFAVVFGWKYGQFIIFKKRIYNRFKDCEGKLVNVTYREVYRVTYATKDGQKQVVAREFVDYDFLDVTLKQE